MLIRNRLYYGFKPFLPTLLRLQLRRWHARRLRRQHRKTWPILPSAAHAPAKWRGWPDGKRFAVVLTHDVEGPVGLGKVPALAALDESFGFRSSFNLVPEGEYESSAELRQDLRSRGFEVGIHDLHHDGKLYVSRDEFSRRAAKINGYVKDWGASGFRSAFMLHNLDWLQELDTQYDASTFDTDPFEPQPVGMGTIFPFWVEGQSGRPGFAELPYTLCQDSTLFLFLGEADATVWREKVDWVAEKGGMVLLNVHPDYVDFENRHSRTTFPASIYEDLLRYLRERYDGQYWHALPGTVGEFTTECRPARIPRRSRRVCMLSHSFYDTDGRVMRYAESLTRQGDRVDVLSLRNPQRPNAPTLINGVEVTYVQTRFANAKSKLSYFWRLARFLVLSSVRLSWRHCWNRYDLVHVHNIPDFLVFAAWLPRLTGSRVILDIHDVVPELYMNKFGVEGGGSTVRRLKRVERLSCQFAHHVIIANDLWFKKVTQRSVASDRCTTFINNVDRERFRPGAPRPQNERQIMLFPGTLQWHQGLEIAVEGLQLLRDEVPNLDLHIYGQGDSRPHLEEQVSRLGLQNRVFFHDGVSASEIVGVMAGADIGVVPKRSDSFGNEAYSTKIMEFMSVGVPVVASRTKIDDFYFSDRTVAFFEPQNPADFARVVRRVLEDKPYREQLIRDAMAYAEANSWENVQVKYLDLVDRLLRQKTIPKRGSAEAGVQSCASRDLGGSGR